jgi:hypothetical protein
LTEKCAQFCPNIAQNGASVNKNFAQRNAKKLRPTPKNIAQMAKFRPIWSHWFRACATRNRVTGRVGEKIAQYVAQSILCKKQCITLTVEKLPVKLGLPFVNFKKLPKANNHPMGKNRPIWSP